MEALGMECKCLGGGKIEHNSQAKKLRVFGESTVSSFDCKCFNMDYIPKSLLYWIVF